MKINKYIKKVKANDYYGFYKLLKKDYKEISLRINRISALNENEYKLYFNFLIDLWSYLKTEELSQINLDILYNNPVKKVFEYEPYESYYSKNLEKIYIKDTNNEKINTLRKYNYIHQKLIQRLILEGLKEEFNINKEDVINEFFLNRITGGTTKFIDIYGEYGDIRTDMCYFFDIFILTNNRLLYKPLTIRYEPIYIDYINYKEISLNEISIIEFKRNSIDITFKNKEIFQIKFSNNQGFRSLKEKLIEALKYKVSKEIVVIG